MQAIFPFVAYAAPEADGGSGTATVLGVVIMLLIFAWYVLTIVQSFLGYGTAYRKAKMGGDNGVSLFGWIIVFSSLASLVPGLGIYFWRKYRRPQQPIVQQIPRA